MKEYIPEEEKSNVEYIKVAIYAAYKTENDYF